jgi:methyltransferase (TIGR00027 family)
MQETDNNAWDITEGVGVTAPLVAMWRMEETASQNPLVDDPYAGFLVQAAMQSGWRPPVTEEVLAQLKTTDPLAVERWQAAKDYASARTRFFDDLLRKACDDQIDQIVILAAGLDSRVWRFTWPKQVTVYEIDQPKVLAFKAEALQGHGIDAAAPRYVPVGIDLRRDWPTALNQSGWKRLQRTVWLVEGLLPYLTADDQDELFERIHALSSAGDWIGVEALGEGFHSHESLARRDTDVANARNAAEQLGTDDITDIPKLMATGGGHANSADWLAQHNWETITVGSLALMARYHRSAPEQARDGVVDTGLIEGRRH